MRLTMKKANKAMSLNKEKSRQIWIATVQITVAILLGMLFFYYAINNSEYSRSTKANDVRRLVNKILKQNNSLLKCVKISGFPDGSLAMDSEYELVAELSNGERLPVKLKSFKKNDKLIRQVEILKK